MRKKAVSEWISYVLLTGFVVVLAAFIYSWMTGYTTETTADVKERVFNSELCDIISISVTACINSSTSQSLYINVTNRGDLRTTKLIFRFLQLSNTSIQNLYDAEIDTVIKPQYSKNISATQLNLTWVVNSNTKVDVVPAMQKDDVLVVCNDRKGEAYFENC
jgi:hypothetical protein